MTEYLIVSKPVFNFHHSGAQLHDLNLSYGQLITVDCDEPLLEVTASKALSSTEIEDFYLGTKKKNTELYAPPLFLPSQLHVSRHRQST